MNENVDSAETIDLLSRVEAGDASARDELLHRHQATIRRSVGRRLDVKLRSRVDPSDVIQETQLDVIRRLDEFVERRPMPFRLWLIKLTHQRLIKVERHHLAAAKRSVVRELPLPEHSSVRLGRHFVSRELSPVQRLSQQELGRRVRRAIASLPENDREILLLRNFEQLSNADAAQLLDISKETTKKRYARALVRLHTHLSTDTGIGRGGSR